MKLKSITIITLFSLLFLSLEAKPADNASYAQPANESNIYLGNAYTALNAGQLNKARNYYNRYKEISGTRDTLFETELSKADGTYIWSEEDLLNAGFRATRNIDDNFNDEMRYASISSREGAEGLIQDFYKDAELLAGTVSDDGYINGIALLRSNDFMELAYVCMGKVMAPSIAVIETPMMIVNGEDPHADERDYLFINEDVVMDQYNYKTGEGDLDWIPYIRQIFSPDVTDRKFLYNFSLGKIDMDTIRRNFSDFVRNENKIPAHLWGYK